jgi:hypothetical protein
LGVFLVERYAPHPEADAALDAMEAGRGDGRGGVRLVLSVMVPGDEIALSLFEAPTKAAVARQLEARGVPYIRIVEALVTAPETVRGRARAPTRPQRQTNTR